MKWLWKKAKNFFLKLKREPEVRPSLPPVKNDPVTKPVDDHDNEYDYHLKDLITNQRGIDLCAESEGLHKRVGDLIYPYLCPANVWTIGRGSISYPTGEPVRENDRAITIEEADYYFKYEIDKKEDRLQTFLIDNNVSLTSNEFSALVSFAYNLGIGVCINDKYTMCRAIKSRDRSAIAKAFLLYDKATVKKFGIRRKVRLRGLTIRRKKERDLFLLPDD